MILDIESEAISGFRYWGEGFVDRGRLYQPQSVCLIMHRASRLTHLDISEQGSHIRRAGKVKKLDNCLLSSHVLLLTMNF